jgi:hypothetical protein
MEPQADGLEAELQQQLAEQQAALEGMQQLLAADPGSAEVVELAAELREGVAATEEALLGLKRQRLLAEIDALQGGVEAQQGMQQLQDQLEVVHGTQQGPGMLAPGTLCIFRYSDGRHYFGRLLSIDGRAGTMQMEFVHPTRQASGTLTLVALLTCIFFLGVCHIQGV